jgi:hypothetical protein
MSDRFKIWRKVKKKEMWPLIVRRGFIGLKTRFKFISFFEFEYRTSCTIKRDTNSGMDETKCLKIFSKTKIITATHDLSASCLSLEHLFPGISKFFPEVPGCSQVSLLKLFVPGGSGIYPGGSGFSKVAVTISDLRVFIPPCLPTVICFLPAPNSNICSPSLPSFDSHLLESKSNPSIQMWSDSLWE